MPHNKVEKQVKTWIKYGTYAPLVFAVGFIVSYFLELFHFDRWMIVAGTVFSVTAVVWWWWTLFTILKLNNTLTRNVEQFLELVNIVKDLNAAVKDGSPNNRKRREQEENKSKPAKK